MGGLLTPLCSILKLKVELCNNLDNKIIESINFIVIKITVFYYRDNSKLLYVTPKANTLVPGNNYETTCICVILLLLHYDNYCY